MGFNFSMIGDVIKGGVEGFVLSGGNPSGAFSGAARGAKSYAAEERFKNQQRAYNKYIQEQNKMAEIFGSGSYSSIQRPMGGTTTANAGFGSGFDPKT